MMIFVGLLIVLATIYLLIKQYETRMVLFISGVLMAVLGGNPLAAFDAFAKNMTTGGLIEAICSVMGFAFVMKYTECDKHLIHLVANALTKVRPLLIPGATLGTFAINIALPSAAGVSAAVGTIFIPILMAAGVHPATAAAAVYAGTFGSLLSPGLAHNPFVAKIAGVNVMEVIRVHSAADIVAVLIGAISITIVAYVLKENNGYQASDSGSVGEGQFKANPIYAVIPILPVLLLVLGAIGISPALQKVGVPHAMLIGAIIGVAVTRSNPTQVTKAFFDGMGNAYGNIFGIIIAAGVFVGGMEAIGLVKAFIGMLVSSTAVVKIAATFGPFLLAIIAGSGDAAAFAFNQAVTPHAAEFGLTAVNMGSVATLGGALGRTMSPIAGAAIICASIAGVNPLELAKRNAPGMIIAVIVIMFMLL
ncbi:MAG: C4-dicarboxylate transporter DcuC [Negativicutes bacterium]|nr:C4-dicarboxylate transporter DcuC [Negativicutes bacterium]